MLLYIRQYISVCSPLVISNKWTLFGHSFKYFKTIDEGKKYTGYITFNMIKNEINELCGGSFENEIVLFGIFGDNIIFYFILNENKTKKRNYYFKVGKIIENISCKSIDIITYICAFSDKNTNNIYLQIFILKCEINEVTIESSLPEKIIEDFDNYHNAVLYDISEYNNHKIICAEHRNTTSFKCEIIKINITSKDNNHFKLEKLNTDHYKIIKTFEKYNCNYTKFSKYYIICCGDENVIKCEKIMKYYYYFSLINKFEIAQQGKIYNLTLENKDNEYIKLLFFNSYLEKIIECNIYPKEYINKSQKEYNLNNDMCRINYVFNNSELSEIISSSNNIETTLIEDNAISNININTLESLPVSQLTDVIIAQGFTKCTDGYYLKYNTKECYNNSISEQGYYLDTNEKPNSWKKCYERCKKCSSSGNLNNMNCYSCIEYYIEGTSKLTYFKLNEKGNCIKYCPDISYLTLTGECVDICPNGTYQYSFNHSCVESCPYNYEINKERNKCIIKSFDQTITSSEFKSQIINDITSFVNSSVIINGTDFKAIILSSNDMDPTEQIKKGISAIDLGNCTQIIKDYYNISDNDYFIVLNMESKNNESKTDNYNSFNLRKNMQVGIFDSSGRKLDISVCKEDIKVMKYIGDVTEELNMQSAMSLSNQGIDVFNANDNFFNDLCHKYENKDGKDIIIEDRRVDIYQNATFCQGGCSYKGIDYELMTANCMCDTSALQNSEKKIIDNEEQSEYLNFKTITKSFISNLLEFNIEVIFCWNLVFDKNILIKNIGFYFMASLCFIQIILLCIFFIKRLSPIKKYLNNFNDSKIVIETAFPPKKIKMLITRERLNRINNQIKNNIIKQNIDGTNINLKKYIDESNIFNNKKIDEINNDDIKRKFQTIKNINNSNNEIPLNKIMEEKFQNKLKQRNDNNKINLMNINSFTKNEFYFKKIQIIKKVNI